MSVDISGIGVVRVTRRDLVSSIAGVLLASLPGQAILAQTPAAQSIGGSRRYSFLDIPNAEDFAPVKGTRWLITSGTTRHATAPPWDRSKKKREFRRGGIYVIDRKDRSYERVWPDKGQTVRRDPQFSDCDAPPSAATFGCSGLHLAQGKGGVHRLYAVHNGERESIEIFEVREMDKSLSLTWIGALLVPYPCRPNSIAAHPDGSLFVSCLNMLNDPDSYAKIRAGKDTGHLLVWHPARGWKKLAGSEGSGPNGVLVSPDGATLYYALAGSRKLAVQSLDRGSERRREVDLGFGPDNLRWDDQGMIWVGGNANLDTFDARICRLDPGTMVPDQIDLPSGPEKYSHCSVAVQIDHETWLGSFNNDRIAILSTRS